MADIYYNVAFGVDESGKVIAQATALDDGSVTGADLFNVVTGQSPHVVRDRVQISKFRSTSWGNQKHADGKDLIRVHEMCASPPP